MDPGVRSRLPIIAIAVWAALQTARISAFPIIGGVLAGDDPAVWLYPGIIDLLIGLSAPLVAIAVWRKTGPWVWSAALAWFLVSLIDHAGAITAALSSPIPEAFLGGGRSTVLTSLVVGAVLDAATLVLLASRGIRSRYLGSVRDSMLPGEPVSPRLRVALVVWALLQIPRLIAVPVVRDILAGHDSTAWLFPAIGDIFIATTAPFVAIAIWRSRTAWAWAGTVLWLVLSVIDHTDTITAALTTPVPQALSVSSPALPAFAFPLVQAAIDATFVVLLMGARTRSFYLRSLVTGTR